MAIVRGSCVALDQSGILITGESGVGKSDLTLRLFELGAKLVSDDYTEIDNCAGVLRAKAPESIRGLFEVYGLGVLHWPEVTTAQLVTVIDLVPKVDAERYPDPLEMEILSVILPCFRLAAFEVSTALKVRLALSLVCGNLKRSP